jgi:glycylpeptide N-tetradecanoyltransferase
MNNILPENYEWKTNIDINIIANFLSENYVEDKKFRYNYSAEFIKWYLDEDSIHVGIYNNELIGFICGKKINICLNGEIKNIAEIDFLCVKKDTRNNKLCPILINEIKNKFNNIGIFDAIFTSEHNYPNQIVHSDYYIKLINTDKLYNVGYINCKIPLYLPKIKGNKQLQKITDYQKCFELYKYFKRFECYEIFSIETFIKRFNNNHINIFGLIENNIIIDFISYYTIDINVINNNINIRDGYLYYYTNNSNNLHKMLSLLIHKLKEDNIDSFIALDIMENTNDIMEDLKFIKKNSNYNYYFFNKHNKIKNNMMAKILF